MGPRAFTFRLTVKVSGFRRTVSEEMSVQVLRDKPCQHFTGTMLPCTWREHATLSDATKNTMTLLYILSLSLSSVHPFQVGQYITMYYL